MGFTVLRRVLRRGSEKGVSRRCLERPLGEYAPLGVRPNLIPSQRLAKFVPNENFMQDKFGLIFVPYSKYSLILLSLFFSFDFLALLFCNFPCFCLALFKSPCEGGGGLRKTRSVTF